MKSTLIIDIVHHPFGESSYEHSASVARSSRDRNFQFDNFEINQPELGFEHALHPTSWSTQPHTCSKFSVSVIHLSQNFIEKIKRFKNFILHERKGGMNIWCSWNIIEYLLSYEKETFISLNVLIALQDFQSCSFLNKNYLKNGFKKITFIIKNWFICFLKKNGWIWAIKASIASHHWN